MKKIGFVLAPSQRLTGALEINRAICDGLSEILPITKLVPDTDFFYSIPTIGYILNYFTLYRHEKDFEHIIATGIATLPFLNGKAKLILLSHGSDAVGCKNVLDFVNSEKNSEKQITKKWIDDLSGFLTEPMDAVLPRFEIMKSAERECFSRAEKIFIVSPVAKKQLVDFFGIPPQKVEVVLNGIPDYWFKKSKNNFTKEATVVYTTRADYSIYTFLEKGHDRAYEILSKLSGKKRIYLNFGTISSIEKYCDKVSKEAKTESISGLSRGELQKEYNPGDIFLGTSRSESFMLTLVEAMASKMVPVVYPVGIAPDIIKNGENGFLINSPEEGIKIINQIHSDYKLRKRVGLSAYDAVQKDFRFSRMISKYQQAVKKIVK